MTHGSLFSGIGGFDLAAEWMGWGNKFHCEWNEFGQKVLHHYWPEAESFTDIKKSDFTKYHGTIDIISGGFPCQPYSSAGKRKGKDDDRHLWPEMLRVVREVRPRWIVGENVLGIVNWNGGLVFEEVQTDLEAEGYAVQSYVLPAASVGSPHRRDRVFFVAYASCIGRLQDKWRRDGESNESDEISKKRDAAETNLHGYGECHGEHYDHSVERRVNERHDNEQEVVNRASQHATGIGQKYALENGELERGRFGKSDKRNFWDTFPSVSPICSGNDGISNRLDGITFSKWRNESIAAFGNAVVPQLIYQIFKSIETYEQLKKRP
jgi:DNA (cytosine-5)-methyltransferase 1